MINADAWCEMSGVQIQLRLLNNLAINGYGDKISSQVSGILIHKKPFLHDDGKSGSDPVNSRVTDRYNPS
jgi:hypothetical protein